MAEHKLAKGKRLIRGLCDLGKLLGYHVEREFPVDEALAGEPPAVDVAWFAESGQKFPLMIFEVESTASNTIANNPLKVFAQDNKKFEKPLFFFQLIASGGTETNRVANLERQYGTQNYRAYVLGKDEGTRLVRDILTQHRRIRSNVDYAELYELLVSESWTGVAAPIEVLRAAYDMGLSPELRLPAYIRLARSHPIIDAELPDIIESARANGWKSTDDFDSYVGSHWGGLVLCAIMICMSENSSDIDNWDKALIAWQTNAPSMPMIAPMFGLSLEYDEFLLSLAAPLVSLAVATARCRGSFPRQMCDVLVGILKALKPGSYGLQTALWLCHLAARLDLPEHFAAACDYVHASGGVTQTVLLLPPSSADVSTIEEDEMFSRDKSFVSPEMASFCKLATTKYSGGSLKAMQLGLRALDQDVFFFEWAEPILYALWHEATSGGAILSEKKAG